MQSQSPLELAILCADHAADYVSYLNLKKNISFENLLNSTHSLLND